ncbi:MAG: hypothetical protein LBU20_01410 [Candidatus Nomurabacteria bacterium]|jgi:hypothetical protein|nr:hypothetical protein [Candidatus Nomurabacteria bacterium]
MNEDITLYKLNDRLLFRIDDKAPNSSPHFSGVYFYCPNHEKIELTSRITETTRGKKTDIKTKFICPICVSQKIASYTYHGGLDEIQKQALALKNSKEFKDTKLIRLDDYYIPELKVEIKGEKTIIVNKSELPAEYKVVCDVKKDKDGDTIIMIQVFKDGDTKGAQVFVKPEKKQLTTDHNNPDPASIISKIEVKLSDRTLTHNFRESK